MTFGKSGNIPAELPVSELEKYRRIGIKGRAGRAAGMQECRKAARKAGRGRRKEGRKEGGPEGRKDGRQEAIIQEGPQCE